MVPGPAILVQLTRFISLGPAKLSQPWSATHGQPPITGFLGQQYPAWYSLGQQWPTSYVQPGLAMANYVKPGLAMASNVQPVREDRPGKACLARSSQEQSWSTSYDQQWANYRPTLRPLWASNGPVMNSHCQLVPSKSR